MEETVPRLRAPTKKEEAIDMTDEGKNMLGNKSGMHREMQATRVKPYP
jgi:hypothetical protein